MQMQQEFELIRNFNAPLELVWNANTEMDQLLQWWRPKGFTITFATLDFREGGLFHYGMKAPNGFETWGKFVYREIIPMEKIEFVVFFSDHEGRITRHPVSPTWPAEILNTVTFSEHEGVVTLTLTAIPINASEEENLTFNKAIETMKLGFKATYDQLDTYLKSEQEN